MTKKLVYAVPLLDGSQRSAVGIAGQVKGMVAALDGDCDIHFVLCTAKRGVVSASVVRDAAGVLHQSGFQSVALTDVKCVNLTHALQVAHAYAERHRVQPLFFSANGMQTHEQVRDLVDGLLAEDLHRMRSGEISATCSVGRMTGGFPK